MEDFSVIPALGRVDSHVRREVEGGFRGAVMRADVRQQWTVPGVREKKEEEVGNESWKERELNREGVKNVNEGKQWKKDVTRGVQIKPAKEHMSRPQVSDQQPVHVLFSVFFNTGSLTIVVLEVSEF